MDCENVTRQSIGMESITETLKKKTLRTNRRKRNIPLSMTQSTTSFKFMKPAHTEPSQNNRHENKCAGFLVKNVNIGFTDHDTSNIRFSRYDTKQREIERSFFGAACEESHACTIRPRASRDKDDNELIRKQK